MEISPVVVGIPASKDDKDRMNKNAKLSRLGELIFFDRYAKKDQDRANLKVGLRVVVCVDQEARQREMAMVREAHYDTRIAKIETDEGRFYDLSFDQIDLPVETLNGAFDRMANTIAQAELPERRQISRVAFSDILSDFSFVPAGRIWAGAGVEERLTPYNCYVLPAPKDSRHGIIETLDRMTEIMSRGGGVGIPLMSLRPRYGLVRGVNGRSSGSVAWGELYSFGTGLIEQGGSRRGALMLIQYDWHPDVEEFINAKRDAKRINNANVSVAISDALMAAVAADGDWSLIFPETSHPAYNTEWEGDIELWKSKGYPVQVYKTLKARDIWNGIVDGAWASAEPGIFFGDRYNKMANSYYYPQGRIWCTNPCGEQGIPPWAVCNLGHVNLTKVLIGDGTLEAARVDWDRLRWTVRTAVRFMDNLIDIAYAPFKENDIQQKGERRIGLGTLGLGEMLIRCHVRYGDNPKCLAFLDELFGTICREAYLASADIAAEKGPFPFFDAEKLLQSGFAKTLPEDVRTAIRTKGLRNVTLLTQAPTGTVGTMMNTSTGIEPFPWWEWERRGRLGSHREGASVYQEYLAAHPDISTQRSGLPLSDQFKASQFLPGWFVTAAEMQPMDHARTQSAIQRWVDSSISKTSNLPTDYTKEQVSEFYQQLYKLGCKGGTVYRDQSRSEQVLNLPETPEAIPAPAPENPELRPVPTGAYDMLAIPVQTPAGKASIKMGLFPEDNSPFEIWLDVSRAGTVLNADSVAIARLASLFLRLDSPVSPERRIEMIIDQLEGQGGGDAVGFGPARVLSIPDGVAKGLRELLKVWSERTADAYAARAIAAAREQIEEHPLSLDAGAPEGITVWEAAPTNGKNGKVDVCPGCHQATLHRSEGCMKCTVCGFSKC